MKYAAELFGTFVLVFAGLGTAVIAGNQVHNAGVAFAFGLSLMAMAYTLGPISGCHINPAVTFGVLLSKRIGLKDAVGYWIAQVIGAVIACGVLLLILSGVAGGSGGYSGAVSNLAGAATGFGAHSPEHYTMGAAFLAEMFLTMLLVITVLGTTDKQAAPGFAGIPIGLILTVTILAGIPVTNASINPARSIGPAVFVGGWALEQLWLFIVAPFAGAVLASLVYMMIKPSGR